MTGFYTRNIVENKAMMEESFKCREFELWKPIAFPEVERLEKLGSFEHRDKTGRKEWPYSEEYNKTFISNSIGTYRLKKSFWDLTIEPSQKVFDYIRTSMVPLYNDVISFEVIEHDNGMVLVVASYSQIIGSRWLAYVTSESVYEVINQIKKGVICE